MDILNKVPSKFDFSNKARQYGILRCYVTLYWWLVNASMASDKDNFYEETFESDDFLFLGLYGDPPNRTQANESM